MGNNISVRRLTKNTLLLYFRMLLLMGVSLYTVRIILATLGVVDYGLFNVVSGIVTLLAFMSNSMASSSQRFFSFELGREDREAFERIFRATKTLYGLLALIVLVLAETLGLWFLENRMVIPADRLAAAFWVYQFSILSFLVTITNTPYMATIISNENMGIYAWVSVVEAVLKLAAVYLLNVLPYDKLIIYAVLVFVVTCLKAFAFKIVCIVKYKEASWRYSWDKYQMRKMLSFTGWNMFGSLAHIARVQGVNVVLNLFFGPVVNAARGVAFQVNSAITNFASNFTTALRPQIVKAYSAGQRKEMLDLVFMSSRFTYFLMLLLSMPVLLETEYLLSLWLGKTSDYMAAFTRIVILQSLVQSLSYSLMAAAQATGKIKGYQILVGGFQLLNLPVVWLLFRLKMNPESAFWVGFVIEGISIWLRLFILHRIVALSIKEYTFKVFFVIAAVTVAAYGIPFTFSKTMAPGLSRFIVVTCSGFVASLATIWSLGVTARERKRIVEIVQRRTQGWLSAPKR